MGFLASVVFMSSFSYAASNMNPACVPLAEQVVKFHLAGKGYDRHGVHAEECTPSPVGDFVTCSVSATKGGGLASESFTVYLVEDCTRAVRRDLLGK